MADMPLESPASQADDPGDLQTILNAQMVAMRELPKIEWVALQDASDAAKEEVRRGFNDLRARYASIFSSAIIACVRHEGAESASGHVRSARSRVRRTHTNGNGNGHGNGNGNGNSNGKGHVSKAADPDPQLDAYVAEMEQQEADRNASILSFMQHDLIEDEIRSREAELSLEQLAGMMQMRQRPIQKNVVKNVSDQEELQAMTVFPIALATHNRIESVTGMGLSTRTAHGQQETQDEDANIAAEIRTFEGLLVLSDAFLTEFLTRPLNEQVIRNMRAIRIRLFDQWKMLQELNVPVQPQMRMRYGRIVNRFMSFRRAAQIWAAEQTRRDQAEIQEYEDELQRQREERRAAMEDAELLWNMDAEIAAMEAEAQAAPVNNAQAGANVQTQNNQATANAQPVRQTPAARPATRNTYLYSSPKYSAVRSFKDVPESSAKSWMKRMGIGRSEEKKAA